MNTTQLCSSVRAVYGNDIDARLYLQKFIHLTWSLSQRERYASDRSRTKYFDYLIADLGLQGKDRETASNAGAFASAIAENKDLSFRTIERVVALIALAVATTPDTRLRVGPLIGGLALVKVLEPSLFSKAKADKMTWADAKTFFGFEDLRDDHSQNWEWIENWWRFVTDRDAPAELIERMERGLFSYGIDDRLNLLSYTADTVMDNISLR